MSNPWQNATPLSNADFKALLATPRPDWASGSGGSSAQRGQRQAAGGGAKKAGDASKPFKAPKPRPKPQQQQGDDEGPKYR